MSPVATTSPIRLAQCAFDLFAERGFEDVSLDEITAKAGVTKGSLYWHYPSRKHLVLAACNHYCRRWHETIEGVVAPHADPLKRLASAMEFSVRSCVVDRRNRLFTTGIFVMLQRDREVKAGWARFYAAVREFFVGLVTAAQRAGQVEKGDARRAVDLMLEATEGIKLRAAFEPEIADAQEQRALAEALMQIVRRPPPARRARVSKAGLRVPTSARRSRPGRAAGSR